MMRVIVGAPRVLGPHVAVAHLVPMEGGSARRYWPWARDPALGIGHGRDGLSSLARHLLTACQLPRLGRVASAATADQ
jgi:hypothetical protein